MAIVDFLPPRASPGTLLSLMAHQGGWDEIALVAVPVLVIALLLVVADKRSKAQAAEKAQDESVT